MHRYPPTFHRNRWQRGRSRITRAAAPSRGEHGAETENYAPLLGANPGTDLTLASRTGRKVRPRQAAVSAAMPRPPSSGSQVLPVRRPGMTSPARPSW